MSSRGLVLAALSLLAAGPVHAADRILESIDVSRTISLQSSLHRYAQPQFDRGAIDLSTPIDDLTLQLVPADGLEAFLADQQRPGSPHYHHWLTPEEFGDRFGLSRNDIAKLTGWLESEGLKVNLVARGRHWITFSGTAQTIGRAFHTEIHRYQVNGETHFANSRGASIPAALAGVVNGIRGLNDFRPQPMVIVSPQDNFGSSHALAPDDLATIFDVTPLYNMGIDGSGQTIAILGESNFSLSDLQTFQALFGITQNNPQVVVVGADPGFNGAQLEAHLDLQWSSAVARHASLVYVYATDVRVAGQYAVDQNLAPIISESFAGCELDDSAGDRAVFQQANAQGITWFVASGDGGAASCPQLTSQVVFGPTVMSPASYPEATAVGGTAFANGTGGDWANWVSVTGASALGYVPETAWAGSGGGVSGLFGKPAWQTGPGVPDDNARDVPDISLPASPVQYPYIVEYSNRLVYVGGTSGGTPVMAGIAALLNQYLVQGGAISQPGLGNINPMLYQLARTAPATFHDITSGNNWVSCAQGSPGCVNGSVGYNAAPGYDQTTGLGSIDVYNLVTAWTNATTSTTTLSVNPASYGLSDTIQLTATVTGAGSVVPTGSVTFVTGDITVVTANVTAASGAATALVSVPGGILAAGDGTVSATYSGDSLYTGSTGSASATFQLPATPGALLVPFVTPNPVVQVGDAWWAKLGLREKAGVGATLTSLTFDGITAELNAFFPGNRTIAPNGSLTSVDISFLVYFTEWHTFGFAGVDANGNNWSQQITVTFGPPLGPGPQFVPSMKLTSPQTTVVQNPQADPSCQWSQLVTVEEESGFYIELTALTSDNTAYPQIQQIFGTTRLAPWSTLQGTICWSSSDGPGTRSLRLIGLSELAGYTSTSLSTSLVPAAANPITMSATPTSVVIPLPAAPAFGAYTVNVSFSSGAPQYTVSVTPDNAIGSWLHVTSIGTFSPGGEAGAQIFMVASTAGLSAGVYNATIAVQSAQAMPQVINIPVTLVVGVSYTTTITSVNNAFSGGTVLAPGALATVYGTQLAPKQTQESGLPWPFALSGVSATVNGVSAPIASVASGQITLQIPFETSAGTAVLGINNNGQVTSYPIQIAPAAPGIFCFYTAKFQTTSFGSPGDTMIMTVTGVGDMALPGAFVNWLMTGAAPLAAPFPQPRLPVTVTIGGEQATVAFAGVPTRAVGYIQINFVVPADLPKGEYPLTVNVGGFSSPPLYFYVLSPQ